MKKGELVKLLDDRLPDDAEIYIGNYLKNKPFGVDSVILNRKGKKSKVIAGIIRCLHCEGEK